MGRAGAAMRETHNHTRSRAKVPRRQLTFESTCPLATAARAAPLLVVPMGTGDVKPPPPLPPPPAAAADDTGRTPPGDAKIRRLADAMPAVCTLLLRLLLPLSPSPLSAAIGKPASGGSDPDTQVGGREVG